MKKLLVLGVASAALELAAACGGNVVVDSGTGVGASGVGGASSNTVGVGASGVNGAGGASCGGNLGPNVVQCGGSAATGAGGVFCQSNYCDMASGTTWQATCQGNTCKCQQLTGGGGPACTCTIPGGGDACTMMSNCCYTTQ